MKKGTVKFFNESKGYGFITDESGKDIFVHATRLNGLKLRTNDRVKFQIGDTQKGTEAINVELI